MTTAPLMRLLQVDSSTRVDRSNSRLLTAYFVEQLRRRKHGISVDYIDVAADPLPHVSDVFTAAMYTPPADRTESMREALWVSDALVDRLLAADAMVFGAPMYNFGMPSAFKAFVVHIVRPGRTHGRDATGAIVGKLGNRQALFITSRGTDRSPGSGAESADALTPGLRAAFGFIGLTDVTFVDAQLLQFAGDERKRQALAKALHELDHVAEAWAGQSGAEEAA